MSADGDFIRVAQSQAELLARETEILFADPAQLVHFFDMAHRIVREAFEARNRDLYGSYYDD